MHGHSRIFDPQRQFLLGAMLVLLTLLAFLPAMDHGFVHYDDGLYVTENSMVQRGLTLEGVSWAFRGFHASNWHPLTWLSHMLDVELFGGNPRGHHLTSLLLHAAAAVTLFLVLLRAVGTPLAAWIGAAFFAIHPLRVESVVWIAERKDVLSVLLGLAAVAVYLRAVADGSRRLVWAVVPIFGLGLLAKPMLVTVPLLLLLLDYWPLRRWEGRDRAVSLIVEKVPLLILSLVFGLVTIAAQEDAMGAVEPLSPAERAGHAAVSVWQYLADIVWPRGLAVIYPHPGEGPGWVAGGLALLGLGIVTLATWSLRRRRPWLLVGWLWFLVALAPVSGMLQVGELARADRYVYFPSVGLAMLLAGEIGSWSSKGRRARWMVGAGAMAAVLALVLATRAQVEVWRDGETLFRHAVEVTQDNYVAHTKLGEALADRGELEEAASEYRYALSVRPDMATVRSNLGGVLRRLGRPEEAREELEAALARDPSLAGAHFTLAMVLEESGSSLESLSHLVETIALDPGYSPAWRGVQSLVPDRVGFDRAVRIVEEAIRRHPRSEALQRLAASLTSARPGEDPQDAAPAGDGG